MRGKVLLINQHHLPLSIHNMDRAMLLWYKNKTDIIESYEDRYMDVFGEVMNQPSVMRMRYFVNITKQRHLKDHYSKLNVWKRDKGTCQYCGKHVTSKSFTVDHVVPRCKGGKSEWANIVTACKPCNNKKDCKTPAQVGMKLIRPPVVPQLTETVERNIIYRFRALESVSHDSWWKYIPKK